MMNFIDGSVHSVGLCFAFSWVYCCFTVPAFSKPFICQRLVEVQLFVTIYFLVDFFCSKDSELVRHLRVDS